MTTSPGPDFQATQPQAERDAPPADGGVMPSSDVQAIAIARQPIVDGKGQVFGYELFDRSRPFSQHDAASDAQLLFNVLSHADAGTLLDGSTMFVNCAPDALASGHLELVQPERVVLEIPPVHGNDAEQIEAHLRALTDARKRGFRLAFNQSVLTAAYQLWLPLASFIKVDLLALRPELIEPIVTLARKRSEAQLIFEKVETGEQHRQLEALGVRLFQGYWFAKPVLLRGQSIRPAQAVIIQLLNLVRKQATTAEIEEVLKHDASLSFNLLRFINSSGFGLSTEITSFRHAVMILGLKKLFRWAALLLTTSRGGAAPPAVGMTAIVRGRLMELLAAELLPAEECDNAFITGVFSLLDTMLGIPLERALSAISLPEAVRDALLHRQGTLAPFLDLAIACEEADDKTFADTANRLALSNHQVNWAHLQALAWAQNMGE